MLHSERREDFDRLQTLLASIASRPRPAGARLAALAFLEGFRTAVLAPRLLLTTFAATVLVVAPVALGLELALEHVIPGTAFADPDGRLVPIDAWDEIARRDEILATFTPAILGLAVPLENISRILDGQLPPPRVAATMLAYAAVWVLLWGGVIASLAGTCTGWRPFLQACERLFFPLARLTAAAFAVYALLFLGVHPILFAGVGEPSATPAREAGAIALVARYGLFAAVLAAVSVFVDFARIRLVLDGGRRVTDAVTRAWRLVRASAVEVLLLSCLTAMVVGAVLAAYLAFEVYARGTPRLWSALLAGQAYVIARLAARLVTVASQIRLVQRLEGRDE